MINPTNLILVIDGEKRYFKTRTELGISEIKVNNVFTLVPIKFYKSLVEDGNIENEVVYNLVYTGGLEGKKHAIGWSNDLIGRWDLITKIQSMCVRDYLHDPEEAYKFYLDIKDMIEQHTDEIVELRK